MVETQNLASLHAIGRRGQYVRRGRRRGNAKSLVLRLMTVSWCTRAVAAMMASGSLILRSFRNSMVCRITSSDKGRIGIVCKKAAKTCNSSSGPVNPSSSIRLITDVAPSSRPSTRSTKSRPASGRLPPAKSYSSAAPNTPAESPRRGRRMGVSRRGLKRCSAI